jgi:putative oxidoreductase
MRLVACIALVDHGITGLRSGTQFEPPLLHLLVSIAGIFLLAGLWTPMVGALVAVIEWWNAFSQSGDPWAPILMGTLGAALAVLGPGAWSADARLFGWKRIDIRDRQS